MPAIHHTSAGGTQSSYRYASGKIDWDGKDMNAVVIGGFPIQGGLQVRAIVANRILAELPDVAAGVWAVFMKMPPHMGVPEWQLLGTGSGKNPLPEDQTPSGDIPLSVIAQLEGIFGS